MKYRIVNPEISYPTDPQIIARLIAGENIPFEDRGLVTHVAGDVVDDVPAVSLESLLAEGAIVPADDAEEVTAPDARARAWEDLGRPADDAPSQPADGVKPTQKKRKG